MTDEELQLARRIVLLEQENELLRRQMRKVAAELEGLEQMMAHEAEKTQKAIVSAFEGSE